MRVGSFWSARVHPSALESRFQCGHVKPVVTLEPDPASHRQQTCRNDNNQKQQQQTPQPLRLKSGGEEEGRGRYLRQEFTSRHSLGWLWHVACMVDTGVSAEASAMEQPAVTVAEVDV